MYMDWILESFIVSICVIVVLWRIIEECVFEDLNITYTARGTEETFLNVRFGTLLRITRVEVNHEQVVTTIVHLQNISDSETILLVILHSISEVYYISR